MGAACIGVGDDSNDSELLAERFTVGRLSAAAVYRPCSARPETPRTEGCDRRISSPSGRAAARGARLAARYARDSSHEASRVRALLDLRWRDGDTLALWRAIRSLERIATSAPNNAHAWNNLAVAYLERGDHFEDFEAYLRGLNAVTQALKLDSAYLPAQFNMGVALARLHLNRSARAAWDRFLTVEHEPGWRSEGLRYLNALPRNTAVVSWSELLSLSNTRIDTARVRSLVASSLQSAREFGFPLLGAWGAAVLRREEGRAAYLSALAELIGHEIVRRSGDRGLSLGTALVSTIGESSRRHELARAHVLLADGIEMHAQGAFDDAAVALSTAATQLRANGAAMWRWALFYRASAEMNRGRYDLADVLFREILTVESSQSALRGKAIWALGVTALRRGNYDEAARRYAAARDDIIRSGEAENLGALYYLRTEALRFGGSTVSAMQEALAGLQLLAPFPASPYLNNHQTNVASLARELGLPFAALAVSDEVIRTSRMVGRPQVVAWALRNRARDHLALGDRSAAEQDLSAALAVANQMRPGAGRDRVRADVEFVLANALQDSHPDSASLLLQQVVGEYRRLRLPNHLPRALANAARQLLVVGDTGKAGSYLEEAVLAIERQTGRIESAEARAAFVDAVDPVFDMSIQLHLLAGRPYRALEYLMRAQARPWSGADASVVHADPVAPTLHDLVQRLQPDERIVNYAVLEDRVAIWVGSRSGWRFEQVAIDRRALASLVSDARIDAVARSHDRPTAGERLYELLLGTIRPVIGDAERLVVVADREVGEVSFASLRDRERSQYAIEQFEFRYLPSAILLRAPASRSQPGAPVLVVGGIRYDDGTLPPLSGAAEEARAVGAIHPGSMLLSGDAAQRDSVLAAMRHARVFHFAGHAVTDRARPERSFLALSATDSARPARIDAREIANLRLSSMRVAVLSACSTQGAASRRGGMIPALAYSFLRSGVSATVSTLWDVEDRSTLELQRAFHARLHKGERVAAALRSAQLSLLKSRDPTLASPSAWAGFVVNGQ